MVFLRCLYRRDIAREMIQVVARASVWLAEHPPKVVDPQAVGLALFLAVLERKPQAVCAALEKCAVPVEALLDAAEAAQWPLHKAAEANSQGQADAGCGLLYSEELTECLTHWIDAAEAQAWAYSERAVRPEHLLLAILETDGPWNDLLARRGLAAGAVREALEAELALAPRPARRQAEIIRSWGTTAQWLNSPAVGVPRRFGVGGMLVIVTMFGLLYGGLQWLHAPPLVFLMVAVFFAGLALGQMLLRGGRFPRAASVKMGAILWPAEVFLLALYVGYRVNPSGPSVGGALLAAAVNIPIGAFLGYLCGCLVAGVVLLLDMGRELRNRFRRSRATHLPAKVPPEPPVTAR